MLAVYRGSGIGGVPLAATPLDLFALVTHPLIADVYFRESPTGVPDLETGLVTLGGTRCFPLDLHCGFVEWVASVIGIVE